MTCIVEKDGHESRLLRHLMAKATFNALHLHKLIQKEKEKKALTSEGTSYREIRKGGKKKEQYYK